MRQLQDADMLQVVIQVEVLAKWAGPISGE